MRQDRPPPGWKQQAFTAWEASGGVRPGDRRCASRSRPPPLIPQMTPPVSWLRAWRALKMRPAAKPPSPRAAPFGNSETHTGATPICVGWIEVAPAARFGVAAFPSKGLGADRTRLRLEQGTPLIASCGASFRRRWHPPRRPPPGNWPAAGRPCRASPWSTPSVGVQRNGSALTAWPTRFMGHRKAGLLMPSGRWEMAPLVSLMRGPGDNTPAP